MNIHFVCHGNAFRSIIAESILKSYRLENVEVSSSGVFADKHKVKNRATFTDVTKMLQDRGYSAYVKHTYADQTTQSTLDFADVVIFLNSDVKTDCERKFPLPADYIVWAVNDIGQGGKGAISSVDRLTLMSATLFEIKELVAQLVTELSQASGLCSD